MNRGFIRLIATLSLCVLVSCGEEKVTPAEYGLIWSDEFEEQ